MNREKKLCSKESGTYYVIFGSFHAVNIFYHKLFNINIYVTFQGNLQKKKKEPNENITRRNFLSLVYNPSIWCLWPSIFTFHFQNRFGFLFTFKKYTWLMTFS